MIPMNYFFGNLNFGIFLVFRSEIIPWYPLGTKRSDYISVTLRKPNLHHESRHRADLANAITDSEYVRDLRNDCLHTSDIVWYGMGGACV
jgi:hypothetical protein